VRAATARALDPRLLRAPHLNSVSRIPEIVECAVSLTEEAIDPRKPAPIDTTVKHEKTDPRKLKTAEAVIELLTPGRLKIWWDGNVWKPVHHCLKTRGWRVDENAFGKVCFFVIQRGLFRPCGENISVEQFFAEFRRDPEELRSKVERQDILEKGKPDMIAKLVGCG
jgi:hypothetical protein